MKHFWELLNKAGQTVSKGARHLKTRLPNQLDERSEGFLIAILSAAAGAVVTNFLGAGGQKKKNEQLKQSLFLEKNKRERVDLKLDRIENKLDRVEHQLEREKEKTERLEQSQEGSRTTNDELTLNLHTLEVKLADILKDTIEAKESLRDCQQHKSALRHAFENSFCFYRQRYTAGEEESKMDSADNITKQNHPGGSSCSN